MPFGPGNAMNYTALPGLRRLMPHGSNGNRGDGRIGEDHETVSPMRSETAGEQLKTELRGSTLWRS